ncbi:MAG: 5'-nucleotidase C-terminal domain-containing protein [Desulfobulbus sp.]|jgi:2',3'-cyclic-nucleotide 2'-phosphodiesterase (5'-nucleotidase family)|nr:5'-nucleotidase C-terminal domain-containing protein [Desulfobulbus sp.]MDY0281235.1 5'-nucleotidase C-terminal domain-containing protein [Salinivirgaceae bacterium]
MQGPAKNLDSRGSHPTHQTLCEELERRVAATGAKWPEPDGAGEDAWHQTLNRGTTLETTMDNSFVQAFLESTGAQWAFSNGWRYGTPIIPGEVTVNDLYSMIPMNPPLISTVELTGEELVAMLEENLKGRFARDPYDQMGGYVKRGRGFNASITIENPLGQSLQQ